MDVDSEVNGASYHFLDMVPSKVATRTGLGFYQRPGCSGTISTEASRAQRRDSFELLDHPLALDAREALIQTYATQLSIDLVSW